MTDDQWRRRRPDDDDDFGPPLFADGGDDVDDDSASISFGDTLASSLASVPSKRTMHRPAALGEGSRTVADHQPVISSRRNSQIPPLIEPRSPWQRG